jgi:hypothetical protein
MIEELKALQGNHHGNLYEGQADNGNAQRSFIEGVIVIRNPQVIFETGTNKGFFGAFLHEMGFKGTWVTCDPDHNVSQPAIDIIKRVVSFKVEYYACMSQDEPFMSRLLDEEGKSLAWIDGDHSYEGAFRDLQMVKHLLNCPILIDDYSYETVRQAVDDFLLVSNYELVCVSTDNRQIAYLTP